MRNTISIAGILLIIALFVQCEYKELIIGEFTMKRENYTGTEIKTSGYWYCKVASAYDACFLYRNGIIYNIGFMSLPDSIFIPMQLQKFINSPTHPSSFWGMFKIDGDNIVIQDRSYQFNENIMVYEYRGKVLNDSTFSITYKEKVSSNGPVLGTNDENLIYHFRSYSPKPDSTNVFVQ